MVGDMFANHRVLALDLETTGISTKADRIVQYALIGSDAEGGEIHVEELVHPRRPIPIETSRIHGIHDEDVMGLAGFDAHATRVSELMEGAVVIGHNIRRFDLPFLSFEFSRLGLRAPKPLAIIDTLEIARRLKIARPHNLGSLCQRHGVDLTNAHTAGADAAATLLLLFRFMSDHPGPFRQSVEEIERWLQGRATSASTSELGRGYDDLIPIDSRGRLRRDGGNVILAFGRHRGSTLQQVWKNDPPYVDWLLSPAGGVEPEIATELRDSLSH